MTYMIDGKQYIALSVAGANGAEIVALTSAVGGSMLARALLVLLCIAAPAAAQQNADWRRPFPAFKLIGNVYWVGTYDLSTYLITTDAGHILINTGFVETVPEIEKGVEQLGFDFDDVEILTRDARARRSRRGARRAQAADGRAR